MLRTTLHACSLIALLMIGGGCVSVYQPLSGLRSPVVVDPQLANFADLKILVHCVPKDILEEGQAGVLCGRIKSLFENQGARVRSVSSRVRTTEETKFSPLSSGTTTSTATTALPPEALGPDLIVELRARHLYERVHYTTWIFSWLTLTLAPGVSENSFLQEVVIRDGRGTLLATGALEGRIMRYFGLGYWGVNALLDLLVRDDDEALTDERLSELLCGDLYGQLSQMVLNANVRRQVLRRSRE